MKRAPRQRGGLAKVAIKTMDGRDRAAPLVSNGVDDMACPASAIRRRLLRRACRDRL